VTPAVISLLSGLAAVAVVMSAAALRSRQLDKAAVVDVAWGAGFVAVALATAVVGTVLDEGTGW
jgi:steroid 5-alpha reductase family enzyme